MEVMIDKSKDLIQRC